jgi:hypothetical protein
VTWLNRYETFDVVASGSVQWLHFKASRTVAFDFIAGDVEDGLFVIDF